MKPKSNDHVKEAFGKLFSPNLPAEPSDMMKKLFPTSARKHKCDDTPEEHNFKVMIKNLIRFHKERLAVLRTKKEHTILQIINQLRSKVSFYGVMKLFDQNDLQKLTNEKLQRENDMLMEMFNKQKEIIETL